MLKLFFGLYVVFHQQINKCSCRISKLKVERVQNTTPGSTESNILYAQNNYDFWIITMPNRGRSFRRGSF